MNEGVYSYFECHYNVAVISLLINHLRIKGSLNNSNVFPVPRFIYCYTNEFITDMFSHHFKTKSDLHKHNARHICQIHVSIVNWARNILNIE